MTTAPSQLLEAVNVVQISSLATASVFMSSLVLDCLDEERIASPLIYYVIQSSLALLPRTEGEARLGFTTAKIKL